MLLAFLLLPMGDDNREDWNKFCRASCSPILSFARGLEPKDKEIGPNFAGELLSELLSYRFLDTDVKSQQRGLDQSLPASCSRNFGSLMLLAFFATERIGPNFAGELYPQLW